MKKLKLKLSEKKNKSVIIVGAGIGGLCTGIRLQNQGYNVTIYEKNKLPGGCIGYTFSKDGSFKIDESASLAINPITYEGIFKDINKNPKDYFKWIPIENYYKVFNHKKHQIYLSNNLIRTQEYLKKAYPKDVEGYTKFIFDTAYKYLQGKENILNHPFIKESDFYNIKTLGTLGKLKPFSSAETYVKEYIKSKELQDIILFQTFFMGVSPYKIPNIYTAVAANTQIEGMAHIEGGLSAYVMALKNLFLELGGKIHYDTIIDRVIYNDKKAKGIISKGQFIEGDLIILNVDYLYGQQKLLGRKISKFKLSNIIGGKKELSVELSCSTFIIHLGFSRKFDKLEIHNLYINENLKDEVGRIFSGKLPKAPSLYIYYPSSKDDSYCKNSNHSVMNIMVRVPNLKDLNILWDDNVKKKLYNCCIKVLEDIVEIKNLSNYILYCSITTPKDFQRKLNYYEGSCFGIGHTFFQSMVFRPQIKDKNLKNLYYVGGSIHPGNGASIVMDCAKMVSQEVINNSKGFI